MKKINFLTFYFVVTVGILYSQQQLFNKYDEIISRVDLGDVGLNGAKTYFKARD